MPESLLSAYDPDEMVRSAVVLIGGIAGPACSLVGSRDVVFTGRLACSNDNGSGRFDQGTLVRFAVEEVFKGLLADTTEVWMTMRVTISSGFAYIDYTRGFFPDF